MFMPCLCILNCDRGAKLMLHKLCGITRSSSVHRTESVMGCELFVAMCATVLDRKQQN